MMKKEEEDEEKLDLELNSMSDFYFWVELSFSPHPLVLFFFSLLTSQIALKSHGSNKGRFFNALGIQDPVTHIAVPKHCCYSA